MNSRPLSTDSRHTDSLVNLGNLSFVEGKYASALDYYRGAEGASPDDSQIKYNLALAYYKIGSRDEARTKLSEAIKIDPDIETQNAHFKSLLDK